MNIKYSYSNETVDSKLYKQSTQFGEKMNKTDKTFTSNKRYDNIK